MKSQHSWWKNNNNVLDINHIVLEFAMSNTTEIIWIIELKQSFIQIFVSICVEMLPSRLTCTCRSFPVAVTL
jgi:hypothetical protein